MLGSRGIASPVGVQATTEAVLFDRDGTLVRDVPYNGAPDRVRPVPGAREAVARLRAAGIRVGVVTNQSGIGCGVLTRAQVEAVNARIDGLVGPFDDWRVCPHDERSGCRCRKPAPGMVYEAAKALGTTPDRCVVVGDIGRDMVAASAAGALGVLVPTPVTRLAEVEAAPAVAPHLGAAADWILSRATIGSAPRRPGGRVLAVRSDSAGDVLLTGPALLCGPRPASACRRGTTGGCGYRGWAQWRCPGRTWRCNPARRYRRGPAHRNGLDRFLADWDRILKEASTCASP